MYRFAPISGREKFCTDTKLPRHRTLQDVFPFLGYWPSTTSIISWNCIITSKNASTAVINRKIVTAGAHVCLVKSVILRYFAFVHLVWGCCKAIFMVTKGYTGWCLGVMSQDSAKYWRCETPFFKNNLLITNVINMKVLL